MGTVQSDDVESDNLSQLIKILQREPKTGHLDPMEIKARLDELMNAVGIFVATDDMPDEEKEAAREFYRVPINQAAIAKDKVQHYAKILESPNPLNDGLIHSIYRTEINALARNRIARGFKTSHAGPLLSNDRSASLTERLGHDPALLRQVVEELKNYNENLVRPGAPPKLTRQTLLIMLAELYVEFTQKDIDPFRLPHSENSRFIQFCHWALKPHLPRNDVRAAALSQAWKRLKKERKEGM